MKTLIALIALSGAALAAPVAAEPANPARAVISTAGLDLGTEAGVRALDLRILHAASELCGTPSSADVRGRSAYAQCRKEAVAAAAEARREAIALARAGSPVTVASTR